MPNKENLNQSWHFPCMCLSRLLLCMNLVAHFLQFCRDCKRGLLTSTIDNVAIMHLDISILYCELFLFGSLLTLFLFCALLKLYLFGSPPLSLILGFQNVALFIFIFFLLPFFSIYYACFDGINCMNL